ncbi:MAG: NADP-dependent malic enzyme [Anaerolineae bacterium]|nr:NADP-dependent malic enzyme [Anaerolineae bacterium]MDH7473240.1 NADP-dependent malic enzyme [Anaerolineae bacterium]
MLTKEELLAKAKKPAEDAMRLHPYYRGKVQTALKCAVRGLDDFAIWYTPGVAAPCRAIQENEELAYEYTNKGNTVAVVSDGTRVLGLGDIGATAGLPVMEGKALLFKYLGGVDAVPLCLDTKDPYRLILAVKWLQPSFGGVNLEDIEQPKCFRVLDMLRSDPEIKIPIWHDDQQGTATVILAGVINALKVVGKKMQDIKVALIGTGAANVATLRLLLACGVQFGNVIACDSKGILHPEREDIAQRKIEFVDKWRICQHSNAEGRRGGPAEAMRGADVCIALSKPGPGTIAPEWVKGMAEDAIIFPCANPIPEIWPWEAKEAGARVVGTGRSDFPNQVNNSLGFPGIFRGVLDVRATTITDEMAIAAAEELARCAEERGLDAEHILPTMEDWEVFPREAAAVGLKAQEQGVARLRLSHDELLSKARQIIQQAQDMTHFLMEKGLIPPVPAEK